MTSKEIVDAVTSYVRDENAKYGGIGRIRCDKGWFYYTAVIPQTEEI